MASRKCGYHCRNKCCWDPRQRTHRQKQRTEMVTSPRMSPCARCVNHKAATLGPRLMAPKLDGGQLLISASQDEEYHNTGHDARMHRHSKDHRCFSSGIQLPLSLGLPGKLVAIVYNKPVNRTLCPPSSPPCSKVSLSFLARR
jgi:hypothetical protein